MTTTAARLRGGVPMPVRQRLADPAFRRLVLLVGSAAGYGLGISAAVLLILHDGGLGYDAQAYWLAGQNVLHGQPLYWAHDEGALGAIFKRVRVMFAPQHAPAEARR